MGWRGSGGRGWWCWYGSLPLALDQVDDMVIETASAAAFVVEGREVERS